MRITRISATTVRVPRPQPFTSSLGRTQDSENAVVQIHTDQEIVGIGEASSIWDRKGTGETEFINGLLGPALIGKDPFRVAEISALMDGLAHRSYPAKAGIEMALHDIVGKALDTPVYNLLGGLVRERVRLSHSLSMGRSEQVAEQAAALAAEGYKTLKLKVGQDPRSDRENLAAIRGRVGDDFTLRVDANMGWATAKDAVRHIRDLETFGLELVEQPLPPADPEGLRFVREHVDVPTMADESVWSASDAMACARAQSFDVFNVYVSEAGGLGPAAHIFAIAEAARIPCIIGSMPELGVGTAAQAHLAFAMRNLGYGSDVNGCVYHSDDVIREELPIEDGYIHPPPGPGLGVSLDPDKVAQYRTGP